ncbi:MAG: 2-amino-3,7-dideoxy-D-threo-hept-6-ulosonate synthase [Candidatus Thermoplasmatota archaeon]
MTGRSRRLARLATPAGSIRMVPLDHGISMGPLPGLADAAATARRLADAGATCFTAHKGLIPSLAGAVGNAGLLLHLSASTDLGPDPTDKRIVATVEEALPLGCDGVSIHINLGSLGEAQQLEDAGRVAAACDAWGMPLLAMVYPRGPKIKTPSEPALVAHAVRLAYELGADIAKVPYTGSAASFKTVSEAAPIPVLAAGGPEDPTAFLAAMRGAQKGGARGFSAGRNLFGNADGPRRLRELCKVFP